MNRDRKIETPKTVDGARFGRILRNLANSSPIPRKDSKTGEKKKSGMIIPPIQPPER